MKPMSRNERRAQIWRRTFDVSAASTGLLVTLPVQLAVAVSIRMIDGPPVIYRGLRVGQNGKPFQILKFRTMVMSAETTGSVTTASDDRLTKSGSALRRWKLDELPQLWNVVRGDMGIVGPRPEVAEYVAQYDADVRAVLLSVRPGLTDPASIAFRSEAELLDGREDVEDYYLSTIMPVKNRMSADYTMRRTLVSDVLTVLRTIVAVFGFGTQTRARASLQTYHELSR